MDELKHRWISDPGSHLSGAWVLKPFTLYRSDINRRWVDRGWSKEAIVKTTSVVDNVATSDIDPQSNLVLAGGIAYAGARGISKVEVQVDNGPWQEAELRNPALGPLTWVQWRYEWLGEQGRHAFRVRAYDSTARFTGDRAACAAPKRRYRPTFQDGTDLTICFPSLYRGSSTHPSVGRLRSPVC